MQIHESTFVMVRRSHRSRVWTYHPIPFEAQITNPRYIIPEIVLHEKRQVLYLAKKRSFDGYFLDLGRLRKLKFLRWLEIRRDAEVKIVPVDEDLEGLRGTIGGRGADQDGVELDLSRESAQIYVVSVLLD